MTYNKIIIKILIGLTVLFTIDFEGMTVSAQNQYTIIVPER